MFWGDKSKSNKSFIICSFPDCKQRFSHPEELSSHIKLNHSNRFKKLFSKIELDGQISNSNSNIEEEKIPKMLQQHIQDNIESTNSNSSKSDDSHESPDLSDDGSEKSAHDIAALALESLGKLRTSPPTSGTESAHSSSSQNPTPGETIMTTTSRFGSGHASKPSSSSSKDMEMATTAANSGEAIPGTDGEYHCYECDQTFANSGDLRRHHKISHRRQTYKCRKCGQLFNSIADRQTHKNNKHFSTISCPVKSDNFKEFAIGTVLKSQRNEAGYFSCPSEYCTFMTRIPGYWYDHIHHVEHTGVNPQRKKRRQSSMYGMNPAAALST